MGPVFDFFFPTNGSREMESSVSQLPQCTTFWAKLCGVAITTHTS
jgi:hypothetical protein